MRNKPLSVGVVDGELRISIGVDMIKHMVQDAQYPPLYRYDDHRCKCIGYKITDADGFAEDVKDALLDESMVLGLLEQAAIVAIREGSEAAREEMEDLPEF